MFEIQTWDICTLCHKRASILKKLFSQTSGILEENYDDVDEIKEKVNEINRSMDEAQNAEPICEESYDDLDTVAEEAQNHLRNGM